MTAVSFRPALAMLPHCGRGIRADLESLPATSAARIRHFSVRDSQVSTPYAPDKLIAQARALAAEYRRAMGKPLPGVSTEIAEHDAVRLLGLEPNAQGAGGWDAVDPATGERIQIKSRTIFDESKGGERIGQLKLNQDWDAVVLVLMDENYEPYEIYRARRDELSEHVDSSSSSRAKRGAMSVARFKIIGELVWDAVNGRRDEVWSNQD
jgi:hypothetical protein